MINSISPPSLGSITLAVSMFLGIFNTTFAAEATQKVRFEEVARSALFVPLYVALSQDYFLQEGLDVSLKSSQGTDKGMISLLSGNADIVLLGPEASIYVINSESPAKPRIFAGLIATDGFMLVARESTQPFDWSQLKDKTVMSYRPGSAPEIFFEQAMKKHGLDPSKDVTRINNLARSSRSAAWSAGQADFAIFDEPEASNLEAAGMGHVVASVGHEVGHVDYTVFTATTRYLENNPEIVRAWVRAIKRGMKDLESLSSTEIAKLASPYFDGLSTDELLKVVDRYRQYGVWKTDPIVTEEAMARLQDMLIESGQMVEEDRVAYDTLVTNEFIEAPQ